MDGGIFTLTSIPFDRLTALSVSKGSPLKGEGACKGAILLLDLYHKSGEDETAALRAEFPCQKGRELFNIQKT
jgi:hypothetical protein